MPEPETVVRPADPDDVPTIGSAEANADAVDTYPATPRSQDETPVAPSGDAGEKAKSKRLSQYMIFVANEDGTFEPVATGIEATSPQDATERWARRGGLDDFDSEQITVVALSQRYWIKRRVGVEKDVRRKVVVSAG